MLDPRYWITRVEDTEHRAWSEEAQGAVGHPDEADLEDAKDFANEWNLL